jgi:hypothetical protein
MSGRPCIPTLYLDGRAYFGGQLDITERDINMLVRPEEIAGIEVYNADQTPGAVSQQQESREVQRDSGVAKTVIFSATQLAFAKQRRAAARSLVCFRTPGGF